MSIKHLRSEKRRELSDAIQIVRNLTAVSSSLSFSFSDLVTCKCSSCLLACGFSVVRESKVHFVILLSALLVHSCLLLPSAFTPFLLFPCSVPVRTGVDFGSSGSGELWLDLPSRSSESTNYHTNLTLQSPVPSIPDG